MNYKTVPLIVLIFMLISGIILIKSTAEIQQPVNNINLVKAFLEDDKTDKHSYDFFTYHCAYFSSDLAKNASLNNISLGTAILKPYNFRFNVFKYHVVNYFYDNESIYFVEPQTDHILTSFDMGHEGYESGMLIPWKMSPIGWVAVFEVDINFIEITTQP